jgi:hypothetical protein
MSNRGSGDDDISRSKFAGRWAVSKAGEEGPARPQPEPPLMVNGVPVIDPSKAFADQIRNEAAVFDGQRRVVTDLLAELRRQEIAATVGGITDPDMQPDNNLERARIDQKYDRISAEYLATIDVEHVRAVHRALREHDHYDRLQPATKEQIVGVEKVRLDMELQDAREDAAKEMKKAEDRANLEWGGDINLGEVKAATLVEQERAIQKDLDQEERRIEAEARARLERMLALPGPGPR